MTDLRLICFAISLCIANIAVQGNEVPVNRLVLSDKVDATGYHTTCHASKPGYEGEFTWEHSFDPCGKPNIRYSSLIQDKHTKIANTDNADEILSTITLVGSNGKEDGEKHCVCCKIASDSMCFNMTMNHEHDHQHHHHHHHH